MSFLTHFEPLDLIGQGGVGSVWKVRHRSSGQTLAVKFLTTPQKEGASAAFSREIRAQRQLHHAGVLPVLAFGTLAAPLSHGALEVPLGSHWCAFDFVDGGSLIQVTLPWRELRVVLLRVLDALAHCHALGLAHLDLKPENVLWNGDPAGVVLADFGLTQIVGRQEKVSGTPTYMAPEQWMRGTLDGRTDLYALGVMTFRKIVGIPPFLGSVRAMRDAHLKRPIPSTEDPDLDVWIAKLTAKNPADRFQSAAMAAAHLPRRLSIVPEDEQPSGHTTVDLTAIGLSGGPGLETTAVRHHDRPVPSDWRCPLPLLHNPGTLGLGELGLREVPVLGRQQIQDRLWQAARQVASGEGAQLLVVQGPRASGRTRLLRWIRTRLRELDAAEALDVDHAWGPDLPFAIRTVDDPGVEGLAALGRRVASHVASRAPVLVVASALPHEPLPELATTLVIDALPSGPALALTTAWLALTPDAAARVVERCHGLPGVIAWWLEEAVRAGQVREASDGVHLGEFEPTPFDAPLTSEERDLLAAVQVLPRPERERVLEIAGRIGVVAPDIVAMNLVRRGLLRERGTQLTTTPHCPEVDLEPARQAAFDLTESPFERAWHGTYLGHDETALLAVLADHELRVCGPVHDRLLDRAEVRLVELGLPPDHLAFARIHGARALGAQDRSKLDLTERCVAALEAGPPTWRGVYGRALATHAETLCRKGRLDEAWQATEKAREVLATAGTDSQRLSVCVSAALIAMNRFDWETTDRVLSEGDALTDLTPAERLRLVPWRRAWLASIGRVEDALEMSLSAFRENPSYHALATSIPAFYWELGQYETAVRFARECLTLPPIFRRIVETSTAMSLVALGRWQEADHFTRAADPQYSERTRRQVRLVCAAADPTQPFDLLFHAIDTEGPPRFDDVWECWLLRTAERRARDAGLTERAQRCRARHDGLLQRLPADLVARIPPAGPRVR